MSDEHDMPALDADALDLLAEGKVLETIDEGAKHATWARVERSLDLMPLASSMAGQSAVALSKLALSGIVAASLGVGAALGGATIAMQAPRVEHVQVEKVVYRDRVITRTQTQAPVQTSPPHAEPTQSSRTPALPSTERRASAPTSSTHAKAQSEARTVGTDVADAARTAERALIAQAQAALVRGRFGDALDAVDAHEARFARGFFEEERDALRVQALAGLGRATEARARAAMFVTAYPRSLLRPLVERAADRAAPPIAQ